MTHHILRLPDVKAATGLSRSTLYLRIAHGVFTHPVSLGGRAVGWPRTRGSGAERCPDRRKAGRGDSGAGGATGSGPQGSGIGRATPCASAAPITGW
jgi:hypothetical protein